MEAQNKAVGIAVPFDLRAAPSIEGVLVSGTAEAETVRAMGLLPIFDLRSGGMADPQQTIYPSPDSLASLKDEVSRAHGTLLIRDYPPARPLLLPLSYGLQLGLQRIHDPIDDPEAKTVNAERYVRAVAERNVRWLVVRDLKVIAPLRSTLASKGFQFGVPGRGYEHLPPFPYGFMFTAFVMLLFALCLWPISLPGWARWLSVGLFFVPFSYSLMICSSVSVLPEAVSRLPRRTLWVAMGWVLGGLYLGLLMAAAGVSRGSSLGLTPLQGVKIAVLGPVVISVVTAIWRFGWPKASAWPLLAGLVVVVMAIVLVDRSGNDHFIPPTGFELHLRDWLDHTLPARPRFKEVFTHPFLWLGAYLWCQVRESWQGGPKRTLLLQFCLVM
ncbi:MAG: DUF5693 family protein, partial [Armatimonadota bacterium]